MTAAPAPDMAIPTEMGPTWIARYYHHPVRFVREVIGAEPDPWQIVFLLAIAAGKRRISVRSGHRVGKSTVVGWAALWYLLTRSRVKVIITAPTSQQLFEALFAEMKGWARRMPDGIRSLLNVKKDVIELVANPDEHFISAATSRAESPEALQGKHSDHVMLIADEASGVPEQVFESAAGSLAAPNAVMILLSNPVRSSGYFYESQTRLADRWFVMHVSSEQSPRRDAEWIEDMALKYGRDSNQFRIRVLGQFPLGDDDTLIPLDHVMSALGRDIVEDPRVTPVVWGLDVARFGNDATILVKRRGRMMLGWPRRWRKLDTGQVAGEVIAEWLLTPAPDRPQEILVDVIGWGAGVYDRLKEEGLPARAINVSEATVHVRGSAALGAGYLNLRAELWGRGADQLAQRIVAFPPLPPMGTLERAIAEQVIRDLTTPKKKFTPTGKLVIESKDELRARGEESPDTGDAWMLTYAGRAARLQGGKSGRLGKKLPVRVLPGLGLG